MKVIPIILLILCSMQLKTINSLYFDLNEDKERCYIDEFFYGNVNFLKIY